MLTEEIKIYTSLGLKFLSLGLVVAAGSFWAGASVEIRPKYRDEQTLVAGTIWSQIVIPIGLIISMIVGEKLDTFIHGYFLFAGMILLFCTGITLITYECMSIVKQKRGVPRRRRSVVDPIRQNLKKVVTFKVEYDKVYLCIGILSLLAGVFTLADFVMLMI